MRFIEVEKRDGALIRRGYRASLGGVDPKGSKAHLRYEVEHKNSACENYDIYDMFADLANAFNDVVSQLKDSRELTSTPAIEKYQDRQKAVCDICKK